MERPGAHRDEEIVVKPSNPLSSRARGVTAFHAANDLYPDERVESIPDRDRVRLHDNDSVMPSVVDRFLPELESDTRPVMVRPFTNREVAIRSFMNGGGGDNATSRTYGTSITCNSSKDLIPDRAQRLLRAGKT